jgi:serine/threonine protein kinase
VYRARDPRLGREVAVKVLPAAFSLDNDRQRRFEREARAAAALNHPNILAVYDIGADGGRTYVVSELLRGETLRGRLSAGALSPRKTIEYGVTEVDVRAMLERATRYEPSVVEGRSFHDPLCSSAASVDRDR